MKKTVLTSFTILCLLSTTFLVGLTLDIQPVRAVPKTWTVDDDGPADFYIIQEAINVANVGDNVFVRSGTYYENVVVNKTISLTGENKSTTFIDAGGTGTVVYVTGERAKVTGFTLQNGAEGVTLAHSSHNTIHGNVINQIPMGILLEIQSENNVVSKNTLFNSHIQLDSCSNNIIISNVILNTTLWAYTITLSGSTKNEILFNKIINGSTAIEIKSNTDNNTLIGNFLENMSACGIFLWGHSEHNTISANTLSTNEIALGFDYSSGSNFIYHNNFINNTHQIHYYYETHPTNSWDDGYPSGGNYWSDHTGTDSGHDGIGDTQYIIDANNTDNYPLMGMFSGFNATSEYHVQTICNSSISDFQFNGTAISFNVSGKNGTAGFCRICIPTTLMNGTYEVFVNGTEVPRDILPCSNSAHSYLYFNYNHSTQEVVIVPEFPSFLILPLFMIITLLAVMIYRLRTI